MIRRNLCVALLAALAGCASSGSGNRSLQSRNLITAAEVQAINVTTVYEAILQLRPHFLQTRGQASIRDPSAGEPIVYVNGVRYGRTNTLQGLRAMDVAEIRFLSASDATTRYGTGHVGGVIEVQTRG